jgi:hypothetical protein
MARLINDVDSNMSKRIFEVLINEVTLFSRFKITEIEELLGVFKLLNCKK